jgi:hypothetical protein
VLCILAIQNITQWHIVFLLLHSAGPVLIGQDLQILILCFVFNNYNGPKELCCLLLDFDVDDGLKCLWGLLPDIDVDCLILTLSLQ